MRRTLRLSIAATLVAFTTGAVAAPRAGHGLPSDTRRGCKDGLVLAGSRVLSDRPHQDREPRAQLLLAVDRRIGGCRVLTPANAPGAMMAEPDFAPETARNQPALGG